MQSGSGLSDQKLMKKLTRPISIILPVILFVFIAEWTTEIGVDGNVGPRIQFLETAHDFGQIPQGGGVKHEFSFRNFGDTDLTVFGFRAGCGCSAAVTSARQIPPGGRGTVRVSYSAPQKKGPQKLAVTVLCNDPQSNEIVLNLSAKVQETLVFNPPLVDLGAVRPGETATRMVEVQNGTVEPLQFIGLLVPEVAGLQVQAPRLPRKLMPGEPVTLEVTVTVPENTGRYYWAELTFFNDHDDFEYRLGISGQVPYYYQVAGISSPVRETP